MKEYYPDNLEEKVKNRKGLYWFLFIIFLVLLFLWAIFDGQQPHPERPPYNPIEEYGR